MPPHRRLSPPVAGLLLLASLAGCGANSGTQPAAQPSSASSSAAGDPAATVPATPKAPLTREQVAALIEGIPGFTYQPAPEVEKAFATDVREAQPPAVRAVLMEGVPQGNIVIVPNDEVFDAADVTNFIAGAENGGGKQGKTKRIDVEGRPAVRTVRADGGVAWSTVKGRYAVIVATRPEIVDDLLLQVLRRLPEG